MQRLNDTWVQMQAQNVGAERHVVTDKIRMQASDNGSRANASTQAETKTDNDC